MKNQKHSGVAAFTLIALASTALTGCLTTTKMHDGSTRIGLDTQQIFSGTPLESLGMPVANNPAASGSGVLDLVPTLSPLNGRQFLYLGGKHNLSCAAAMLYSAKSDTPLEQSVDASCRDSYLNRQQQLKRAGRDYDRNAPSAGDTLQAQAYWNSLRSATTARLGSMNQIRTRFTAMPQFNNDGAMSIRVRFLGGEPGQYAALHSVPVQTPVYLADKAFEAQQQLDRIRTNSKSASFVTCDATLNIDRAVDNGPRPRSAAASEYTRFVVQYYVDSMGCRDATKTVELKSGGPATVSSR